MIEFMDASTGLKKYTGTAITASQHWPSWCKTNAATVLHTPESGLNSLADHAGIIFNQLSLITQQTLSLETKKKLAELLDTLRQDYQQLDYSQDISLAAHYIVCATVDDILRCAGSHEGQFLQKFHNSRLEQEKFYSILEHIHTQSDKYIDLLELMYLCLRFGYKGQYRHTPFGLQQWAFITDNVYRAIAQARGQHSYFLSADSLSLYNTSSLTPASSHSDKMKKQQQFYIVTLSIFITLMIVIGFIFQQTYNKTSEVLTTHHSMSDLAKQEVTL